MTRLVALAVLAFVVGLPLTVLPSPHLGWLLVPAMLAGALGVVMLSVPLTTAGAALTLIAYTAALLIGRPRPDLVTATVFGIALVLLLTLVHFAQRVDGAAITRAVIRSEVREWLMIVAVGALAAVVLTMAGIAIRVLLPDVAPAVAVAAAVGALVTVVGTIALVTTDTG